MLHIGVIKLEPEYALTLTANSEYSTPFVNNSNSLLLLLIRNLTSADYREGTGVLC